MFPWKSVLVIEQSSSRARYLQLVDQMIKEISAGRLQPSQKIPGTRRMAALLHLNRKTVIQAYEELMAQGWLEIRSSSGTYISEKLPVTQYIPLEGKSPSNRSARPASPHSFDFIDDYTPQPQSSLVVDGGSPDHRLAPVDWIFKECRSLAKSRFNNHLLAYSDVRGDKVLRKILANYLSESRGMNINEDNVLITRGSQMGIFLGLKAMIRPNDPVVVGDSGYDAADWAVRYHRGQLERVTVDHLGLNSTLR